jgi:hypothetical protein
LHIPAGSKILSAQGIRRAQRRIRNRKDIMNRTLVRRVAGPVIGAGGGYLVFKWITCRGGG